MLQGISGLQRDHLFGNQSIGLCNQTKKTGPDGLRQDVS